MRNRVSEDTRQASSSAPASERKPNTAAKEEEQKRHAMVLAPSVDLCSFDCLAVVLFLSSGRRPGNSRLTDFDTFSPVYLSLLSIAVCHSAYEPRRHQV